MRTHAPGMAATTTMRPTLQWSVKSRTAIETMEMALWPVVSRSLTILVGREGASFCARCRVS